MSTTILLSWHFQPKEWQNHFNRFQTWIFVEQKCNKGKMCVVLNFTCANQSLVCTCCRKHLIISHYEITFTTTASAYYNGRNAWDMMNENWFISKRWSKKSTHGKVIKVKLWRFFHLRASERNAPADVTCGKTSQIFTPIPHIDSRTHSNGYTTC